VPDDGKIRPKPVSEWSDVYDLLKQVRLRPGMWVRSVEELSAMLFGYSLALQVHGAPEGFDFHPAQGLFAGWLSETQGWSMARGWATAIEANAQGTAPLQLFFSLLDDYRAPTS
jgi:hypothetical protein